MGYQMLRISSDFGAHFWWFLSILGAWEPLLEAWGTTLSPRFGFLWFWCHFRAKAVVPFWLIFGGFLGSFLSHFLIRFWKSLFGKYAAKSIQNGRLLEVSWRSFLGTGDSLIFDTPLIRNPIFWGREGTHIASFLVTFLRVLSGRPLEHGFLRFWAILGSLWEAIWLQKGIKSRDQKSDRKGDFEYVREEGPGPL